jgi:uncharacterized DUF497 family protein
MDITFDPAKSARNFEERGMSFDLAAEVFDGEFQLHVNDNRRDYGELRTVTFGHLRGRMVVVVWTQRGAARHIISMRKANEREQRKIRF